ncbi:MAG: Ig-like domain-containing protein [Bacteroidota bacterium]
MNNKQLLFDLTWLGRFHLGFVLVFFLLGIPISNAQDFYEAESYPTQVGNAQTSSQYSGYTGSGYVTGLTSEWSYIGFDKSNNQTQPAQLVVRYANGNSGSVNHLGLQIGSGLDQMLSFPSTGSWTSWDELVIDFTLPLGYQGIRIDGQSNASSSVNIDSFELRFGDDIQGGGGGGGGSTAVSGVSIANCNGALNIGDSFDLNETVSPSNADDLSVSWSSSNTSAVSVNSSGVVTANAAGTATITVTTNDGGFTDTCAITVASQAISVSGVSISNCITSMNQGASHNLNETVSPSNATNKGVSYSSSNTSIASVNGSGVVTANAPGSVTITVTTNDGGYTDTCVISVQDPPPPPAAEGVIYEAENMNRGNAQVSSACSGYSGTGYVTGFTSEWSTLKFEKSYSDVTPVLINIRYSNGTGQTINNIDLKQGNVHVQTLSFPPTAGWNDYQILTSVPFNVAAGYQGILLDGSQNVSESVNIDYLELLEGYTPPPGAFSITSPANGAQDQALSLNVTWSASSSATNYDIEIDNNSNFGSPLVSTSQTGTSYNLSGLDYSTTYYIKVTASNSEGSEVETASFTTEDPPPPVGSFSHTSPSDGETDVATSVALSWSASANADSYSLVVSTNSNLSNPIVNAGGISGTSYNVNLLDGTTYYWRVTAANEVSTKNASKTSFTTLVPPAPGSFGLVSPANNATEISRAPVLSWSSSDFANSYSLKVSKNSNLSNPAINVTGITGTSYSASGLDELTKYYWRVTAVNSTGTKNSAKRNFTTQEAPEGYHVSPSGSDVTGTGTASNPWKTIAHAASQVPANQGLTIYLSSGTFTETEPIELPTGVNVEGAGEGQTTINSSGVTLPAGVTGAEGDFRLWPDGSLFQLVSTPYTNGTNYGPPEEMAPAANGNQTLSGFTINGQGSLKAGIWVMSRNNVTAHHITIKNTKMNGAVFGKSDMWWYEPMPETAWMQNTTIHDMTFIDCAEGQKGCLRLAGLDGADIYNIDIDDRGGAYGIKFMYVGHYKNLKIHDCNIRVSDYDPEWGEAISIELWNFARASNSEIYNINCNTWLSLVNHTQIPSYEPEGTNVDALDLHHITMIDEDGSSGKEAIEAALSGVKIHDCYLQDKGFGIAIWNGVGTLLKKNYEIYNNVITNVDRDPGFGFGNSSAIFVPDPAQNLKVYNNVFERMGVALDLGGTDNADVKNNIFIGTEGEDVKGGNGDASNNLKYHTNSQKAAFNSTIGGSNNVSGNPGLSESGARSTLYSFGPYYEPTSSSSLVVDAGTDVGLPFSGDAPDIGAFEFNSVPTQAPGSFSLSSPSNNANSVSVNPTLSWSNASSAQSYTVDVATNSNFGNIVYTKSGITTNNVVVDTALDFETDYYWRVKAINIIGTKNANGNGRKFTTEDVPPPPGSFGLSSPANNASNVSKTPTLSWTAASNASSYTLVISKNSNFSNPVVNQANIPGTDYSATTVLDDNTKYYWKVTAFNAVGNKNANGNGRSFTTTTGPLIGNGLVNLEVWEGIPGDDIINLTGNVNYPDSPDEVSTISETSTPSDVGSDYGQKLSGYLLPQVSGSYQFAVSGDDDVEMWLSTDAYKANKVKIAYFDGWTYRGNYGKYPTQQSGGIQLVAGAEYYFEILHKEKDGGDHAQAAWKVPGSSDYEVISGNVLSSVLLSNLPKPEAFSLTAPSNSAVDVSRFPTLEWSASNLATNYEVTVSTNSNLSNPIISEVVPNNAYTIGASLQTSTTYYWAVTAFNEGGTLDANNNSYSFTTEAQPLPGSFSVTQPVDGTIGTSWNPFFAWTAAAEANSYTIKVSKNSNLSSPVINESGITATSFTVTNSLEGNTQYFWKVSAVNNSGSTDINGGTLSFTTDSQDGLIHVMTTGNDNSGDGTLGNPYKTVSYAASQVSADLGLTLFIHPGTFNENTAIKIPTGVNVLGSGEGVTIIKAGNIGNGDGKEDYVGSLFELVSPNRYGEFKWDPPREPANGNQTISGFTIDGNSKQLKAGMWLQNRNNVTIHHVTIKECAQRGAVACFGDKDGREEPPFYIQNLTMHDMTFIDSGADLSDESLGNLCIGHTDGAEFYNITIDDEYGYGIKFIFEGYYKNTIIHDCDIQVNEQDPLWTEDIAIELWNLGPGNEVYNVNANTWFSFVNWADTFNNPSEAGAHLKVHGCRIVDNDGTSIKEAIEAACSGVEVYNCYIENKGWAIAQWLQGERKMSYHHNIFRNTQPQAVWTDAGAIFIVADEVPQMEDVSIYNNVFDNLKTGGGSPLKIISVWKGTVDGLDIANNVTTNVLSESYDFYLYGAASVSNASYRNNFKDVAHNVTGITSLSNNLVGDPGFKKTGLRWEDYYQPTASSFLIDAGADVGMPFSGSAPDIGKWEVGMNATALKASFDGGISKAEKQLVAYPNPTNGELEVLVPEFFIGGQLILSTMYGSAVLTESVNSESTLLYLGGLPSGVYVLQLVNGLAVESVKVVKR